MNQELRIKINLLKPTKKIQNIITLLEGHDLVRKIARTCQTDYLRPHRQRKAYMTEQN